MRVFLSGGLGNQLFQVAAGRLLSSLGNGPLVLDPSWTRISRHPSNQELLEQIVLRDGERISGLRPRILSAGELVLSERLAKNNWIQSARKLPRVVSGTLAELQSQTNVNAISGSFTDPSIHRLLRSENQGIELRSDATSRDFRSNLPSEYAAVHVRGGDYFELKQSFGVLSESYYSQALSNIPSGLPLVMVTNDGDYATQLQRRLGRSWSAVFTDRDLSPVRSLRLLSSASILVAANSSYSWWGAELGEAEMLIGPSTYSPMAHNNWMLDPRWISVEGSWVP